MSADYYEADDYGEARAACHADGRFYTGLYGYSNSTSLRAACLNRDQLEDLTPTPKYLCEEMSTDGYLAGSNSTNTTHLVLSLYQTFCKLTEYNININHTIYI